MQLAQAGLVSVASGYFAIGHVYEQLPSGYM